MRWTARYCSWGKKKSIQWQKGFDFGIALGKAALAISQTSNIIQRHALMASKPRTEFATGGMIHQAQIPGSSFYIPKDKADEYADAILKRFNEVHEVIHEPKKS